jgi:hypothetical protein
MINWQPGLILRISNYRFEDDQTTRDKYSIVLYTQQEEAFLIHSLTTSQNRIVDTSMQHGCTVHKNIPYYFFPAGLTIGNQGFSFDKDTFVFFMNNVRKERYDKLEKAAAQHVFGVVELGVLDTFDLKRIIKCALKSNYIPENIADLLKRFKESL